MVFHIYSHILAETDGMNVNTLVSVRLQLLLL